MAVLFDIYCIPERPFSVDWSALLGKLLAGGLVRPPFWAGQPLRAVSTASFLRPPDLPPVEAILGGQPDAPQAFEQLEAAVAKVARDDAAMVAVEVPAASVRREPQKFHPMASYLGLYRFRAGHSLVVGEPADPAWQDDQREASWRGQVFELLWIHGKNAPLREDFEGSPLHLTVSDLWPGCLVLADARL